MFRYVHCKEFMDFLCISARGNQHERGTICFNICDIQRREAISRNDLSIVLCSVADLLGCKSTSKIEELINKIFLRYYITFSAAKAAQEMQMSVSLSVSL